jgi:hypothetical protein
VAGTYGRGAWEAGISGATGVAEQTGEARHLMLDPPSPNPAQGSTVLRFAARHEGGVDLAIYDVLGTLVQNLDAAARGDGVIRTAVWTTGGVAPGEYFVVLRAGNARLTRKIVVAK